MMRTSWRPRTLAMAVSLALLAVACGGQAQDDAAPPDALDATQGRTETEGDAGTEEEGGLVLNGQEIADAELLAAAQEEGRLVLYTALNEEGEIAMGEEFTADTGIDVEVVRLPGGRLDERILSEHGAGELPADVVHQSDPTTNLNYHERGIVVPHPLPEPIDSEIEDRWKHPEDVYYQTFPLVMGFLYNTELVSEEEAPRSWEDLLDPKWKGKIIMPFAGIGGSGWSMALFQRQVLGEDYWEALAAQEPTIGQSAAGIAEEVARGEYPVAINSWLTSNRAAVDGAPLATVFPEEGSPAFPYALSLVDGPNHNAGKVYMNWRNSLRGLSVGVETIGTHVAHPEAPAPWGPNGERVVSFEETNPWLAEEDDWVNLRDEWVEEWNAIYNFSPE